MDTMDSDDADFNLVMKQYGGDGEEVWKVATECTEALFFADIIPGNQILYENAVQLWMLPRCIQSQFHAHLVSVMDRFCVDAVRKITSCDAEAYECSMAVIAKIWTRFMLALRALTNIFDSVESSIVCDGNSLELESLWHVGGHSFARAVAQRSMDPVVQLILRTLRAYRSSDLALHSESWEPPPVSAQLKTVLQMFRVLNMYMRFLKEPLTEDAANFYAVRGQEVMQMTNLPEYLFKLERSFQLEVALGKHLQEGGTDEVLIDILHDKLMCDHRETLLDKERFAELVEGKNMVALRRMYRLFYNAKTGQEMEKTWVMYVKEKGATILTSSEDCTVMQQLIEFKLQLEHIHQECFGEDDFSCKEAFEYFLNQDPSRSAMLLAHFFGVCLEGELTMKQHRCLQSLFCCLQAKDIFEVYFTKDLHQRLLSSVCVEGQEMEVIEALRMECGPSFTGKMDGMTRDIQASNACAEEFTKFLDEPASTENVAELANIARRIKFTPVVLTTGFWPSSVGTASIDWTSSMCQVGSVIASLHNKFKEMYLAKHNKRTLKWMPAWGTCTVRVLFGNVRMNVCLSHAQAFVLFHYQDVDTLTYDELCASMHEMGEAEIKRAIQSLCLQKNLKVLLKSQKTKNIERGETISFNTNFRHQNKFISLNTPPAQHTREDLKKTEERVHEDRQFEIEAVIVRTMKAKQSITHNDLMAEVLRVSILKPQPSDIKKRIESLISRDYIARNPLQPDHYNYVA